MLMMHGEATACERMPRLCASMPRGFARQCPEALRVHAPGYGVNPRGVNASHRMLIPLLSNVTENLWGKRGGGQVGTLRHLPALGATHWVEEYVTMQKA